MAPAVRRRSRRDRRLDRADRPLRTRIHLHAAPVRTPGAALLSGGLVSPCHWRSRRAGNGAGAGPDRSSSRSAPPAGSLALWAAVERRAAQPMVDVRMPARRSVPATSSRPWSRGSPCSASSCSRSTSSRCRAGSRPREASLVHYGFDATGTQAGLYLLPASLVLLAGAPLAGLIAGRTGPRDAGGRARGRRLRRRPPRRGPCWASALAALFGATIAALAAPRLRAVAAGARGVVS
jgi:hypothetical protein